VSGKALLLPRDLPLWQAARPYLDVRNNDEHTLVAYSVASQLLAMIPDADEAVVLPAILLHDVGWKRIPPDLLLEAIGKTPTRPDLVRKHELEGVEIAREILRAHRPAGVPMDQVLAIIDGHDTDRTARSLNDAVVKDADKLWRVTPHGMRVIRDWYGWSLADYVEMVEVVSNPRLLTPEGKQIGEFLLSAYRAERDIALYMEADR
jgi:hypothetical protein